MAWVVTVGGSGQESAGITAVACLGLTVIESAVRWWQGKTLLVRIPDTWSWTPITTGIQLTVVLMLAQVAQLRGSPTHTALIAD